MGSERLQKLISRAGLASRRTAEEMIRAGRVTVDGRLAEIGQQADPSSQRIEVDGIPLPVNPQFAYWLVNKPLGVVCTVADPEGRRTVTDLVPPTPRVYPVGRLDINSGGLIMLTNDGDFTNVVTHPRHGIDKTYSVLVEGLVTKEDLRRLTDGIDLEDGPARATSAGIVDRRSEATLLELSIGEGRNREVRRMCEALGFEVKSLFRTRIGPITDGSLRSGQYRALTLDEVRAVYAAGMTT